MIKLIKYKGSKSLHVYYIIPCVQLYFETVLQYLQTTFLAGRLINFAIDDKNLSLSIKIEKKITKYIPSPIR